MNPEVTQKINRITDILWAGGVTNPVTYIEQLSYLIFLKMYDEKLQDKDLQLRLQGDRTLKKLGQTSHTLNLAALGKVIPEKYLQSESDEYSWSSWKFKSGTDLRDFLRDEVFPHMATMVKENPEAAQYFRDAQLEIQSPDTLKEVIDILDTINFSKLGPDTKGDLYEYLLTHLGQSALNGQFRTPKQIRAFMVEMVDPDLGDTVLDPAAGTGGFLLDAFDYIRNKYSEKPKETPIYGEEWLERTQPSKELLEKVQKIKSGIGDKIPTKDMELLLNHSFQGYDVSRQMIRIATMNMILHGLEYGGVRRGNSLSDYGGLTEEDITKKYSVILSNPPFSGVVAKDSIRKDIPTTSKKTELLFLAMMMDMLAPGGRAAVVVPEGLLFGSTKAHVELRRKLMEEFELLAVVSLPEGVFKPYAGVKTGVVIFRKPEDKDTKKAKNSKVWFYEIKNDGYDPDKISGGIRPETPDDNDIPELLEEWLKYKKSGFKELPGAEANTFLKAESEEPTSWWATIKTIAENDYNLAAGRYKPQIVPKTPDDDLAEIIRETLAIENDIVSGLTKLLQDMEVLE